MLFPAFLFVIAIILVLIMSEDNLLAFNNVDHAKQILI